MLPPSKRQPGFHSRVWLSWLAGVPAAHTPAFHLLLFFLRLPLFAIPGACITPSSISSCRPASCNSATGQTSLWVKKKSHLALTWTSTVTSAYLCCSNDLSNLNKILVTLPLPVVYGFGSKKNTWQTLITLFVRGRQMGQWWRYSWATQTDIFKEKTHSSHVFGRKKCIFLTRWQKNLAKKNKYFKPKHELFLTLTQSAFSA